jgi:XTP/dITP diphosphohydrolase
MTHPLLIATHNPGKKAEFAVLLDDLPLELLTLDEAGLHFAVTEDGDSYAANALLKAHGYAMPSGLLTLADDSGLDVDALDGAPGVYSARYGGPGLDDRDRYELLLAALRDVPPAQRTARFRCVIALAWPDGRRETAEGVCEGSIALAPRGEHGFGYDPVFLVGERPGLTMAELPPAEKNVLSHRARAAAQAREVLRRLLW